MTMVVTDTPSRDRSAAAILLVAGVVLATLTEAIAGTVLSLGRGYIIGDTYATPDEAAWLDIGYTASKLIGFMISVGTPCSRTLIGNASQARIRLPTEVACPRGSASTASTPSAESRSRPS